MKKMSESLLVTVECGVSGTDRSVAGYFKISYFFKKKEEISIVLLVNVLTRDFMIEKNNFIQFE